MLSSPDVATGGAHLPEERLVKYKLILVKLIKKRGVSVPHYPLCSTPEPQMLMGKQRVGDMHLCAYKRKHLTLTHQSM